MITCEIITCEVEKRDKEDVGVEFQPASRREVEPIIPCSLLLIYDAPLYKGPTKAECFCVAGPLQASGPAEI